MVIHLRAEPDHKKSEKQVNYPDHVGGAAAANRGKRSKIMQNLRELVTLSGNPGQG
jgi:hypothetical protein